MQRGGAAVAVNLSIAPLQFAGEGFLLVSFADDLALTRVEGSLAADFPHVTLLEQELEGTRKELESAIQDFDATNDELMAANEEAMSINEELQSTNEELEASKEELQSLNEELTALNSQLSGTIEHQRATANDLRNTMDSSEIAMLFLDGDLKIRLFTPAASSMFNVIASDIGRPLADLARRIKDPRLLADAADVLTGRLSPNREVEADNGAWFTRRIVPYRNQDDLSEGVVITFTDISEGRRPNGKSKRRGPIPTASSIRSGNRSSCSTLSFASSRPAAPSTTPSPPHRRKPWADVLTPSMTDASTTRRFAISWIGSQAANGSSRIIGSLSICPGGASGDCWPTLWRSATRAWAGVRSY